jgi:hypothetical protein
MQQQQQQQKKGQPATDGDGVLCPAGIVSGTRGTSGWSGGPIGCVECRAKCTRNGPFVVTSKGESGLFPETTVRTQTPTLASNVPRQCAKVHFHGVYIACGSVILTIAERTQVTTGTNPKIRPERVSIERIPNRSCTVPSLPFRHLPCPFPRECLERHPGRRRETGSDDVTTWKSRRWWVHATTSFDG